jgi:T5orf172 domain
MRGWVYVITNKAMPELVKVGYSTKDPEMRAQELADTGTPHAYVVEFDVLVENPRELEQKAHAQLADFREKKEWFRCSVTQAISAIKTVCGSSALLEREGKEIVDVDDVRSDHYGMYLRYCRHCGSDFSRRLARRLRRW